MEKLSKRVPEIDKIPKAEQEHIHNLFEIFKTTPQEKSPQIAKIINKAFRSKEYVLTENVLKKIKRKEVTYDRFAKFKQEIHKAKYGDSECSSIDENLHIDIEDLKTKFKKVQSDIKGIENRWDADFMDQEIKKLNKKKVADYMLDRK